MPKKRKNYREQIRRTLANAGLSFGVSDSPATTDQVNEREPFPLLALPDEIIVLVLQRMPLAEQVNVYETCPRLRALLAERHVISRRCSLGRSPLATANTLRRLLFRDLASRIVHIDLSCVFDLSFKKLVPSLKRMTNLTSIDISRSNLSLSDLCEGFPSVKNISIDYGFTPYNGLEREGVFQNLKSAFKNTERIHLVANFEQAFMSISRDNNFMAEQKLKEVQFTCNRVDLSVVEYIIGKSIALVKALHTNYEASYGDIFYDLPLENATCLFIENYQRYPRVLMSTSLYDKLDEHGCHLSCDVSRLKNLAGKTIKTKWSLYIWHPKIVEFNKKFYEKVFFELEQKIPIYVCTNTWKNVNTRKQNLSNSYYISTCTLEPALDNSGTSLASGPKKRRSRLENVSVDLDKFVKPDKEIKLTIAKFCSCNGLNGSINLNSESACLRNLTFLHLRNICSLHATFFQCLFRTCKRLTTLNLDHETFSGTVLLLCNALHLAGNLKNLRIREPANTHSQLYPALSRCSSLENVHICEVPFEMQVSAESLIEFIGKCKNLYSFHVYSNFSSAIKARQQKQLIKKAAPSRNMHVEFYQVDNVGFYCANLIGCDQFCDVFFQDSVFKSIHLDLEFPHDYKSML